jgi:hypothetical protein
LSVFRSDSDRKQISRLINGFQQQIPPAAMHVCVLLPVFFYAAKVSADYSRRPDFRERCIAQMMLKSYTSYSKKHHQIESGKCIIIFRKHVSETLEEVRIK